MRVRVARVSDVGLGRATPVEVNGKRVALCRPSAEEFYAIDDTCSHALASLSEGELVEYEIECPRHGAHFDIRTGEALTLPATKPIKTYRVVVEEEEVFIEVPE
ncbi:MAG: non-heme iron oxygenase ferredoxin subunit [Armatimonadota bacterium]|nr:non-heme iron oxygenase ferredoxin subunit [bacterium]MDW8322268.1 non-heme iron oxygenase ferredoxin subunit [Armatimonadota bacterium]